MISRIWHGWTSHDNADAFEALLKSEVCAGEDYETAYVPSAERQILEPFDARSVHYDVRFSPFGKA